MATLSFASCKTATLAGAREKLLRGEYFAASEDYRKVYRNTTRNERALRGVVAYEMGEAYRRLNFVSRAATAYANAIRYNYPDTAMYLRYAQTLHREGKYAQAQKAYLDFLALDSANVLAINGLSGVQNAQVWIENPSRYSVKRMDLFNSNRSEFSPMFAQNDAALYITSSRNDARGDSVSDITGLKNNDIFVAVKNDRGEWQKPTLLESEINTKYDEGTPSVSADGSYMYYTFSPIDYNRPTAARIYYSRWGGNNWDTGQELSIHPLDSLSLFAHPSVSPSGEYIYFVSDMAGGYGGKDIWRAGIDNNIVLFTENLGPDINTAGDEMFPYCKDDSTLYFSSDGHPGMGGLDLFKALSSKSGGHWSVENMKFPVNSPMDDFGITLEKGQERGFFSSNRGDARGRDHIYSFEYNSVKTAIEGIVVDENGQLTSGVKITVVANNGYKNEFITNMKGVYRFEAEQGVDYLLMANAENFLNAKRTLKTVVREKDSTYLADFEMIPYNKPVVLENIFYDFDKAVLRPESQEELDTLAAMLNENPSIAIELSAHTDRKGDEAYNQNLSLRRAQSVAHYLIAAGINPRRLSTAGFGKTRPKVVSENIARKFDFLQAGDTLDEPFIEKLVPEQQDIADQINRRTEFRIVDTTFGLH